MFEGAAVQCEKTLERDLAAVFKRVRAHDQRHTFRRRLRAVGMSLADRQKLLGHKSGRMTPHFSAAEIRNLLAAANRIANSRESAPQRHESASSSLCPRSGHQPHGGSYAG